MNIAAYCRVSTDKEDQANSFETQQRYFREYIARQPGWELAGIFADEGLSGTSTKKHTRMKNTFTVISTSTCFVFLLICSPPFCRLSPEKTLTAFRRSEWKSPNYSHNCS